ncbi:MAG: helix-turn-helix domain-containing protein [Candidatus Aenigmarchaeota archaeon]|nr:helix-turn-helix domain-containing protein [Candidatus Aenigmarchaeota archaeon]
MEDIDDLKKKIAGEIVLSNTPGNTIKKWRQLFKISQAELSKELNMSSSVISDYESGRRKSPGTKIIEKIVNGLIKIDLEKGGKIIDEFMALYRNSDFKTFILKMKDFEKPVKIKEFLREINGEPCYEFDDRNIYGYSLIDSQKAILNFSPLELSRVSSLISRHCMIFTNLKRGRSPMVAIRLTNLKPGLIVFHGIKKPDELALRIAKLEKLPLAISYVSTVERLMDMLESLNNKF